jgi:hypothetical protein
MKGGFDITFTRKGIETSKRRTLLGCVAINNQGGHGAPPLRKSQLLNQKEIRQGNLVVYTD